MPSALPSKKPSPRGTPASRPWPSPGEGAPRAGLVRDGMGNQQEKPPAPQGQLLLQQSHLFRRDIKVLHGVFGGIGGQIFWGSVFIGA